MNLQNKNVLIFGLGKSGYGAFELLNQVGANITLYDSNTELQKEDILEKINHEKANIVLGTLTEENFKHMDLVVISPGVPVDLPILDAIRSHDIPVWGEIELAYQFSKGKVVAITGTNGKTTTTALVGEIMKNNFPDVYVVGNIGNPYTGAALKTKEDSVIVAEISSFQLETIASFRPEVSAVLNVTPDHLNRHHTMETYIQVKQDITKFQTSDDTCVLNYDNDITREMGTRLHTKVLFFSRLSKLEKGIYLEGDTIIYNDGNQINKVCRIDELKLLGGHNVENVMAAIGIALSFQVPMPIIIKTVCEFKAVEHRIEYVATKNGVDFYNDSKGTNPDAAIKGIQAMVKPTVLIGGGYDKNSDYEEWINAFDGKVKWLVLLGQTREKIAETARRLGFTNIIMAESLEEAIQVCVEKTVPGDAVLLSPACASWGMFPNYEVRGKMFKDYVNQLKG